MKNRKTGAESNTQPAMPRVPKQHASGRLAERILLKSLPPEWPHSQPTEGDDYGFDITLSIVDGDVITGRLVHLQVKGFSQLKGKDPTIRLKLSTLNFMRASNDAAQIIAVDTQTEAFWHIGVEDTSLTSIADAAAEKGRTTFSFHFLPIHRVCSDALRTRLSKHSFRSWSRDGFRAPIGVLCPTEDIAALHRETVGKYFPSSFRVVGTDSPSAQFSLTPDGMRGEYQDLAFPWRRTGFSFDAEHSDIISRLCEHVAEAGLIQAAAELIAESKPLLRGTITNEERVFKIVLTGAKASECTSLVRWGMLHGYAWASRLLRTSIGTLKGLTYSVAEIRAAFLQPHDSVFQSKVECAAILANVGYFDDASQELANFDESLLQTDPDRYLYARAMELLNRPKDAFKQYYAAVGHSDSFLRMVVCAIAAGGIDFEPFALRPIGEAGRATATLASFLFSVTGEMTLIDKDEKPIELFATTDETTSAYHRASDLPAGTIDHYVVAGTLALMQSVRTNECVWWARSIAWFRKALDAEEATPEENLRVFDALLVTSATRHGSDALRMSLGVLPPFHYPVPLNGNGDTAHLEICARLDAVRGAG